MGLTQKLGTIPLAIQTDSSNNIGIGGAANASYKLAVTGASLFSSSITGNGFYALSGNSFRTYRGANDYYWQINSDSNNFLNFGSYFSNGSAYGTNPKLLLHDNGNVGIGTSSPDRLLHLAASQGTLKIQSNSTSGANIPTLTFFHAGNDEFVISGGDGLRFLSSGVNERMRITGGGSLLVGNTSNDFGSRQVNSSTTSYTFHSVRTGTGSEGHLVFSNANGAVGSIFTNGTATLYNATSDYRLKQDLKDYNGLQIVSAIKTYDYEWKSDKTRMYGVLAHELAEVIPYCVTGEKDAEQMQAVDYSKLVPILIKSIQELSAKVTALENK